MGAVLCVCSVCVCVCVCMCVHVCVWFNPSHTHRKFIKWPKLINRTKQDEFGHVVFKYLKVTKIPLPQIASQNLANTRQETEFENTCQHSHLKKILDKTLSGAMQKIISE